MLNRIRSYICSTIHIHPFSYSPLDLGSRHARRLEGELSTVVFQEFSILEAFGDNRSLVQTEPGLADALAVLVGCLESQGR